MREAERNLGIRLKENKNIAKWLTVSQHILNANHNFKNENMKLLHNESKNRRLTLLKAMEIYREKKEIVCEWF